MATVATGAVLLCRNGVGTQPISRVNVARTQSAIVAGLTLANGVATLATTRLVASDVAMSKQPIVAMQQGGCGAAGQQQLARKAGAHPPTVGFMTHRALRARITVSAISPRVTTHAQRFRRQPLRT